MISPQEPGNDYYYPPAGTSRISYTHPAVAYTYWRKRIGEEIAVELEQHSALNFTNVCHCADAFATAADIARGK